MTTTAIYTCYRQLHPPTGVDHAVFGSVTDAGSRDLVVAKASILELYRVHKEGEEDEPGGGLGGASGSAVSREDDCMYYLELLGTFPLAGNINGLAVIPIVGGGAVNRASRAGSQGQDRQKNVQDILVVCFGGAKMSLVAYDKGLGRLTTLSIHNYDADGIGPGSGGVQPGYSLMSALADPPPPISAFDPAGRCCAMVVGGCQLVVLPVLRHVPPGVFLSQEARDREKMEVMKSSFASASSPLGKQNADGEEMALGLMGGATA
ncbi:unnamed protein product, partial [Discosporangium mesarthrocarpum]